MTYHELKKIIENELSSISDEKEREALLIIEHASHFSYSDILLNYKNECPKEEQNIVFDILKRRLNREPLQYILGKVSFFDVEILVKKNVLIPRFDTEVVCEKANELLKDGFRVADICCGSGCIGLSLAKHKDIILDCFDISNDAISLTKENANNLGITNVNVYQRDVFSSNFLENCPKYDLIISNPPYIETKEIENLQEEVKNEPILALDGGEDGLLFYRRILELSSNMLNKDGYIIFEIGYNQGDAIKNICRMNDYSCVVFKDYGGNDRGCIIQKI